MNNKYNIYTARVYVGHGEGYIYDGPDKQELRDVKIIGNSAHVHMDWDIGVVDLFSEKPFQLTLCYEEYELNDNGLEIIGIKGFIEETLEAQPYNPRLWDHTQLEIAPLHLYGSAEHITPIDSAEVYIDPDDLPF